MKTVKAPARWVVRVVYPNGVAWLRRGSVVGCGPIVRFPSKRLAEVNAEMIAPGLDEGCVVSVVRVAEPKQTSDVELPPAARQRRGKA